MTAKIDKPDIIFSDSYQVMSFMKERMDFMTRCHFIISCDKESMYSNFHNALKPAIVENFQLSFPVNKSCVAQISIIWKFSLLRANGTWCVNIVDRQSFSSLTRMIDGKIILRESKGCLL